MAAVALSASGLPPRAEGGAEDAKESESSMSLADAVTAAATLNGDFPLLPNFSVRDTFPLLLLPLPVLPPLLLLLLLPCVRSVVVFGCTLLSPSSEGEGADTDFRPRPAAAAAVLRAALAGGAVTDNEGDDPRSDAAAAAPALTAPPFRFLDIDAPAETADEAADAAEEEEEESLTDRRRAVGSASSSSSSSPSSSPPPPPPPSPPSSSSSSSSSSSCSPRYTLGRRARMIRPSRATCTPVLPACSELLDAAWAMARFSKLPPPLTPLKCSKEHRLLFSLPVKMDFSDMMRAASEGGTFTQSGTSSSVSRREYAGMGSSASSSSALSASTASLLLLLLAAPARPFRLPPAAASTADDDAAAADDDDDDDDDVAIE